jgi:hypothetical protein
VRDDCGGARSRLSRYAAAAAEPLFERGGGRPERSRVPPPRAQRHEPPPDVRPPATWAVCAMVAVGCGRLDPEAELTTAAANLAAGT